MSLKHIEDGNEINLEVTHTICDVINAALL
jgi:hypothetical protein